MVNSIKTDYSRVFIHMFFIAVCFLCLIPFLLVVAASFSYESDVMTYGFKLIPKKVTLSAYSYILGDPGQILSAYRITVIISVLGTFLSVFIMALVSYPLSRANFRYRRIIMFYFFFTMLFNGGLVPRYLLVTKYLMLQNTIWAMILPGLVDVFHIIILRTFFQQLPVSIIEAAKIDGASELRIFITFAMPISKPVIATVSLLGMLIRWNEWYTAMLFITDDSLIPLQFLLQKIIMNMEFLRNSKYASQFLGNVDIPGETARMAMVIVTTGPMVMVFPFFQKYFVRGITVGSLKG